MDNNIYNFLNYEIKDIEDMDIFIEKELLKLEKIIKKNYGILEEDLKETLLENIKDINKIESTSQKIIKFKELDKKNEIIRELAIKTTEKNNDIITIINKKEYEIFKLNVNFQFDEILKMLGKDENGKIYSLKKFEDVLQKLYDDFTKFANIDQNADEIYNFKKFYDTVINGLNQGFNGIGIANTLSNVLNISLKNALMKARTSVTNAMNKARLDSAKYGKEELGLNSVKIWSNSNDARVRKSHVKINGEERELEEIFSNGVKYPADHFGSWSEIANCRCSLRIITKIKDYENIEIEKEKQY